MEWCYLCYLQLVSKAESASVRLKAWLSFLGKRSRNLVRSPLLISRVFAFNFAYTGSANTWFDYSYYGTFHHCLWWTCLPIDSHMQHIVLATEETTVIQHFSHRPIKCQSQLWSQRGTTVNGSRNGDSPLLKPSGVRIATKPRPGTTNCEHRKLIGVKTVSLFGYGLQFYYLECCQCFRIWITSYRGDCLMCCPTNKVTKSMYSDALCACCGTLSGFPLQYCVPVTLAFGKGAVAKPSTGFPLQYRPLIALAFERGAVARLSRHDQAHRLTVKRLGRVGSHYVLPFESKFGLTSYRKYLPGSLA